MSGVEPALSASLSVDYANKPGVLRNALVTIRQGEILGLVGQSGSGKSTLALALLRLLDLKGASIRGHVRFQGRELMGLSAGEMRRVRGKEIGLVMQSPMSALNPALCVGTQMREAWRSHEGRSSAWKCRTAEVFKSVSLPTDEAFLRKHPRHLSVGLAQRVLIGMAILHRPSLLIADEPTSALDVITQASVLDLFARLSRQLHMALLFISHDLLSVAALCDRVAILHEGRVVEVASSEEIFNRPSHPYTRELLAALPRAPVSRPRTANAIREGEPMRPVVA